MRCSNCGICCIETEMLLSERDVIRLLKKGFKKNSFAVLDKAGYLTLKNRDGCCVFYDRELKQCRVYNDRPSGCRVYPVILDEDEGTVLDNICPCIDTISALEKNVKAIKVVKLLKEIDSEATRRLTKNSN